MPNRGSLTAGTIAGATTIGSSILLITTIAVAFTGAPVGLGTIGVPGPGGLLLVGAIAFGVAGFGMIGLVGRTPLDGRVARAGLVMLALGLLGILMSSLISVTLTYDPLESLPAVFSLVVGLVGLAVGIPCTVIALLVKRGAPRRLALMFLGGLVLVIAGGNVAASMLMAGSIQDDARVPYVAAVAVVVAGAGAMIAAFGGIGWLAIVGDREPRSSAA